MKVWTIRGQINNGCDGFPNIVSEMNNEKSEGFSTYLDVIEHYVCHRDCKLMAWELKGFHRTLAGEKYRRYEVELLSKETGAIGKRTLFVLCEVVRKGR